MCVLIAHHTEIPCSCTDPPNILFGEGRSSCVGFSLYAWLLAANVVLELGDVEVLSSVFDFVRPSWLDGIVELGFAQHEKQSDFHVKHFVSLEVRVSLATCVTGERG